MIELHPNLENLYSCPVCDGPVELKKFIINGMRNLVDITCPACERSFYSDIPAGHGLFYPFTIDQQTLEIFQPLNPFGRNLREMCQQTRPENVELKVIRRIEREEIILLNCLDTVYGHSLLKLLNAQYYVDNYPELGCCVLVPRQLTHLVPDGVAEIWEVSLSFSECRRWWVSLENKLRDEILKRKKANLALAYPHPHHTTFSMDRFAKTGDGDAPSLGSPTVVFCYRTARLWGATLRQQRRNIVKLYKLLHKSYPELTFFLIGPGDGLKFPPQILDKRVAGFDLEMERYWLELLRKTQCAVGVMGSNMYLPSALAECVVEMIPEIMYGNLLNEYLLRDDIVDPYENLFRFRVLYGNDQLTDVSPHRVAQVVASQLSGWERFRVLVNAGKPSPELGRKRLDPIHIVEMHARYRGMEVPPLIPTERMGISRKLLWYIRKIRAIIPL